MPPWTKTKVWALGVLLAIVTAFLGVRGLNRRRHRKAMEVTSLRVQALSRRADEEREIDTAKRIEVAEARRTLEAHVEFADRELDAIYRRIDERETRIMRLRRRIDIARGR